MKEKKWVIGRLPEENGAYLVTFEFKWGKEVDICYWVDGKWFEQELAHRIVAWMDLPEAWEGGDE